MLNLGPSELLLVMVVALLVLGPSRLPDAARQVGRALGEFRRVTSGFQSEVRDAMTTTQPPAAQPTPDPDSPLPDADSLPTSPEQAEVRVEQAEAAVDRAEPGAKRSAPDA